MKYSGIIYIWALLAGAPPAGEQPDAEKIVRSAFNYLRGAASISTVRMTIHRPNWERVMTIEGWTRGEKESLILIVAPPKDQGNGTLKKGREMWIFNPKVNRVIKLPPSMMSQAWMGSDFSNNDLAKSDSLLGDYTHTLIGTAIHEGKKVYLIKSVPEPQAPVVWGMQKLWVREDNLFLREEFYDEDLKLVKTLSFLEIQELGGQLYPKKWKMEKAEEKGGYTIVDYQTLTFLPDLDERLFTLSNLRNPRR